jgi:hypothetical protein
MSSALYSELKSLEGLMRQNPETGALNEKSTYLGEYTNRIFGSPYQFMDDVDKRFDEINSDLGNEYLRNIILNSPILHIKPGMPYYTGGDKSTSEKLLGHIKNLYIDNTSGMSTVESLLGELVSSTVFGGGSKLQRRMFGFRETYYDYMSHVNYMCRSVATMLNLTTDQDKLPWGTYVSTGKGISDSMESFATIKWQNYRMLKYSYVKDPAQYFLELIGQATISNVADGVTNILAKTIDVIGGTVGSALDFTVGMLTNGLTGDITSGEDATSEATASSYISSITDSLYGAFSGTVAGTVGNKVTAVEFMVEPGTFEESMSNETKQSAIASAIESVGSDVGAEIGWITNSNADTGTIGDILSFLGDSTETVATGLSQLVEGATGGFATNLFSGAIQSIKGQKMIYPEIYEKSNSSMNYTFTINLTSPYGDVYNYYMNIVVPLLHLIALVAPRMVTANTTASPYLVQCYIPGQCTCHLGIVESLTITKNPNQKRVSVNGFPLEVKVQMTIKELYNAMAISPANDPASFLFNETLNDYLANMAGLLPSVDTYSKQRKVAFQNLALYFTSGEWANDAVSGVTAKLEDLVNPFVGR